MSTVITRRRFITCVAVATGLPMLMAPVERRLAILKAAGGQKAIYVTPEGVTSTVEV
ncbi:MAG: hypothetical protein PHP70_07025 [Gallionella sp.]|nr:hypothetical protein [Gallionella sp.]